MSAHTIVEHGPVVTPPAYIEQLTEPQKLRAENKTRRAVIEGRKVRFQRLSDGCKVHISWGTFWTVSYRCKEEAAAAAVIWEQKGEIKDFGFTEEK